MRPTHREPGPVPHVPFCPGSTSTGSRRSSCTLGLATLMRGARIGQQNVVIEANGVRVAAQGVEGQGEIFAVIPRGTIGEDYLLQIAVYSSAVGSPSRLGPYAEPRAVGLCLKSLKVELLVIDPLPVMLTTEPDRSAEDVGVSNCLSAAT